MAAVPGMSCINPRAPLRDTARALKPDSTRITADTSCSGTPWRCATSRMVSNNDADVATASDTRKNPSAVPELVFGTPAIRRYLGSLGALVK
jgi:hypothetical protein